MGRPIVTAFGKMRLEAEFIGFAEGQPQISFAQWLDEGIGFAVERGGPAWRERFQAFRPRAFLYRAPAAVHAKSLLLGVLTPSEDRFARPFPFATMTELRESSYARSGSSLPVAAERFVAEVVEICHALPSARRASDLLSRAQEIVPPSPDECSEAAQDIVDWQASQGIIPKLWSALFPSGGVGLAERVLRLLVDAIVPMRTHGAIGTSRAVRLPIGNGGAVGASFWLEVVRALAEWSRTIPAAFWPADDAGGSVLIQLGEVPPGAFVQLWSNDIPDPLVLDLAVPSLDVGETPELHPELAKVVRSESARVRDLLDQLARAC